jgi:WD40 repeat protein
LNDVAVRVAELPKRYPDSVSIEIALSPDGASMAMQSNDEKIDIWDWRKSRIAKTIEKLQGANHFRENTIQFSPDGQLLAACHTKAVGDVIIRTWHTGEWSVASDIADRGPGVCSGMTFSNDGHLLFAVIDRASAANEVIAYDTHSWTATWRLALEARPISVAVSPTGGTLAVSAVRRTLLSAPTSSDLSFQWRDEASVYLINTRERTISQVIPSKAIGLLAWSPDGSRIAVAGHAHVELFDPKTGEIIASEKLAESTNLNVRFTANGRYLIVSDMNGRGTGLGVGIWESDLHKLVQKIPGNVGGLAVSGNGEYLGLIASGHPSIWQFK